MAVRRWVDLSRYDGAELVIATGCPPDGGHRLAVRNYIRSDLSQFGFTRLQANVWLGSVPSFKTSDLRKWFPGFDPARDIREFDTAAFLVGYEDLDLANADFQLDELIAKGGDNGIHLGREEQARRARAEATPEQIAAVLADFPSSEALLASQRSYTDHATEKALEGLTQSDSAQHNADALRQRLDQKRQALRTLVDRYDELRTKGLDAVSDYDILLAFQGDALFALRGSLNYQRSLINDELDQILALTVAASEAEDHLRVAAEARQLSGSELLARKGDVLVDQHGENAWWINHDVVTQNPFMVFVTVNRDQLNERTKSVSPGEFLARLNEDRAFRATASENATTGTNAAGDEHTEDDGGDDARVRALQERVTRFASGMSRANDFHPAARAEHGIGVDIGELSDTALRELADRIVNMRARVFVDSGAFGLFKRGLKSGHTRPMNFDAVLSKYERLQQYIAEANAAEERVTPPMLVMPDVVGDQAASLELVRQYRDWIRIETEFRVSRPVVPLQRGDLSLSEAYAQVVKALGSDRFIVGIPSNAAAVTPEEFVAFLRECKPKAVHILGALADSRLAPRLHQIVEAGLDGEIEVSADANILRSKILTKDAPKERRAERIEQVLGQAAIRADLDQARRANERDAAALASTTPTVDDLDTALVAARSASSLPDAGFSIKEDGRFRKVMHLGKHVCTLEGSITRRTLLAALEGNAEVERQRVGVLLEVASIRRGEHPGFRGLSDAVANADFFLSQYARQRPEQAKVAAAAWLGQPEHYSRVSGLSPARVKQLGNYLFAQHRIAIASQDTAAERRSQPVSSVEGQSDRDAEGIAQWTEVESPRVLRRLSLLRECEP